jgi:MFS family permease
MACSKTDSVKTQSRIWSALSNPLYFRLWLALIVSGCCVSAHEMAATWAMNSLGAPALLLSLMSSAGTLPFFLFTLPAGALADLIDRQWLMRIFNCWLACNAGVLAICAFFHKLTPEIILAGVFLLGTGFAFQAPVASAWIPEIVGKEQLPSAIALGGVQMNLAGIIGPVLGGILIPVFGVSMVFAIDTCAFILVFLAVLTWKGKTLPLDVPLEGFLDSLVGAVRYMRYASGVRVVLLRSFLFGILIGATPALLPVIGLKVLHLSAVQLGFMFTFMAIGSLAAAVFILEPARKRLNPNQITVLAGVMLTVSYASMAFIRQPQIFLLVAAAAGAAWTISASELWVAGQRVIPDWIRGRVNSTHMTVSQGGMAVAGLVWGTMATVLDVKWALLSASSLGIVSTILAGRWSIDFSGGLNLDPDPLPRIGNECYLPEAKDGPITTMVEIEVAPENHRRLFKLAKEVRLLFLRNGAFNARMDQDIENPNRFRLYSMINTWVAYKRLRQRITRDDHALLSELLELHIGTDTPTTKRYLGFEHWMPEESAVSRLKPMPRPQG